MKRHLRRLLVAALLTLACSVAWAGWLQVRGNFHPVIAGELYRSGQPTPEMLQLWVAQNGIRSVLNLRGPSDAGWYRDEIAASARLSLTHADFAMRDDEILSPERAADLLRLMRSLPTPLLIHCKAGADRTGLAAALYLAGRGQTELAAESQISFRYGHVGLPGSAAWPINQSWEAIEPSFNFNS